MKRRPILLALGAVTLLAGTGLGQEAAVATSRPKASLEQEIDALAGTLVEGGLSVGLVVGTLQGDKTWIKGYGRIRPDDAAAPDGDTVYEIGSITKVFTGLLLADAVVRGDVKLDDPVVQHLPKNVTMPTHEKTAVRLVELSTHTSALPRLPGDFKPADLRDPYAGYDARKLYKSLAAISLQREPGSGYAYSNLGAGLLGHTLCLVAGKDYEALVQERITVPLGMGDTAVKLSPSMQKRLAPPFDAGGRARTNWTFDTMAGAGALRSTVKDLLAFARANLDPTKTKLEKVLKAAQEVHYEKGSSVLGLGWHMGVSRVTIWHNGGTGGYRSFLAVDPQRSCAAVVLANTTTLKVDGVGTGVLALLQGQKPKPIEVQKAIEVKRAVLERYVGTYELAPGLEIVVTLDARGLQARLTGQEAFAIHPSSETRFFYRVVPAALVFEVDAKGKTTGVVLHQNGRKQRAQRK